MAKQQINFRASDLTRHQLNELGRRWGMNQSEVISIITDRIYQEEIKMVISYEVAKKLAEEKGLDPTRLHKALNWLAPQSEAEVGKTEIIRQALSGEFSVINGRIVMHDKMSPDRHNLDDLYNRA